MQAERAAPREGALLPPHFVPESWASFSFQEEEITMALLGLPGQFAGVMRYR